MEGATEDGAGLRLSFALPASKPKRLAARPALATDGDAQVEPAVAGAFVSSFSAEEPTLAEAQRAPPKAIALVPNTNLLGVEKRGGEGANAEEETTLAVAAPTSAVSREPVTVEDENAAAAAALLAEVGNGSVPLSIFARAGGAAPPSIAAGASSIERPADAQDIAYDEMPVEEFGSAMLRGMGWTEGLGVGRNINTPNQPVEYVARHHRLGLGAQPKAEEPHAKKHARPGQSREPKPDLVYVDAEGRQRHVKPVGEKLTVRGPTGFQKGAPVRIAHGAHAGLEGTIQSTGGIDGQKKASVTLRLNGETVLVPFEYLALPTAPAAPPVPPAPPLPARAGSAAGSVTGSGRERDGERKRERDERAPPRRDEHARDRSYSGGQRGGREADGVGSAKRQHTENESAPRAKSKVWVVASIRVRVVDQRVHRGALYNKKGVVVDTGGAGEFALLMDEDEEGTSDGRARLREGITQQMVETALPKPGGSILVVRGELRGRRGRLLERDSRKDKAVVQLNGDFAVCTLGFDDISEWAGHAGEAEDDEY